MNTKSYWSSPCMVVDIGQNSLRLLEGTRGAEAPLERAESGRLTPGCQQSLKAALQAFLGQNPWRWKQRVWCALNARGVSLRRIKLPQAPKEEWRRLLALQIESEFPLPPEGLAWGYCPVDHQSSALAAGQPQEVIVAALKREAVEQYAEVFSACGLTPVFTLAAVARSSLCPSPPADFALLDVGERHSELVTFEQGAIAAARILPWGLEEVTRAIQAKLGITREQAELLAQGDRANAAGRPGAALEVAACFQSAAETLASSLERSPIGRKLYLTGESARLAPLTSALAKALGPAAECEQIRIEAGPGRSAATLGLQKLCAANGALTPLTLQMSEERHPEAAAPRRQWRLVGLACALAVSCVVLRYAEAFLYRGALAKRLQQISSQREGLPAMDREFTFLQYLQTNQPPILDAMFLVADAAPKGARLDSVSLSRRGDLSLRGAMGSSQETSDFRSKLIDSGFFSAVVLDEQSPSQDRQKVTFRLSAQLKPDGQRPLLSMPAPKDAKSDRPGGASTNQSPPAPAPPAAAAGPGAPVRIKN